MVGPWSHCTKSNKNTFEWVFPPDSTSKPSLKSQFKYATYNLFDVTCHKIGTVCSMLTTVWKVNREDRFPLASCLNSILFLLERMVLFSLPYHGRQPYPNTSLHKQQLKSQKTNCNLNSVRRTMSDYPSFHRSEQRIWKVGAFLDQRTALILFKICKITGLFKNNEACSGKALTF